VQWLVAVLIRFLHILALHGSMRYCVSAANASHIATLQAHQSTYTDPSGEPFSAVTVPGVQRVLGSLQAVEGSVDGLVISN
jgi:hypothetical protein